MIHRKCLVATGLLLIASSAGASSFVDRFSFKLSPGGVIAMGGHFTDSVKLNKAVGIGIAMTAALRVKVTDYFVLDAGYTFDWMAVKKSYRPFEYKEQTPALNLGMMTLNGTLFMSQGYAIAPYLTFGAGMCPWQFSRKALGGGAWPAPGNPANEFSAMSFGLNTGLGAEISLSTKLNVFVEAKYHYIFARNISKFGTDDFNQQDFLGLNIGLVFHLGKT
jgi:opacity protein-like surface antigen